MKSEEKLESDLSRIASSICKIEGVVAVILFGSYARGEADMGSDMDIFALFENADEMRRNEWEVTRAIPRDLFVQSICSSTETLENLNPVLINSILKEGIVLYIRSPLSLPAELIGADAHFIVSYSLRDLGRDEKQRLEYKLFGKEGRRKYAGLVRASGGQKLGRGCFVIPEGSLTQVTVTLDQARASYRCFKVYLPSTEPTIWARRIKNPALTASTPEKALGAGS